MKKVKKRRLNKKVFIKRILILCLSVTFVILIASSGSANDLTPSYKEITVKHGDTLWIIAKNNRQEGVSIEEAIYKIKKVNRKTTSSIVAGEKIKIPLKY